MNNYLNFTFSESADQYWTKEWFTTNGSMVFRKCLVYLELTSALISLALNSLVMVTVLIWNSASCRGYFYGVLNLTLAQCLISVASVVSAVGSLWVLDFSITPAESKDRWWRSMLQNIIFAMFYGLSVTSGAAISWTHWWSLNVTANHEQMPSGYRVIKVIYYILWFTTIMFGTWFNSSMFWRIGLTTTISENDERAIQPYIRTYSITLFISVLLLLFSNLTSIPPVTGHLTARAIQGVHQYDCGDADCVCSDSEVDHVSNKYPSRGSGSLSTRFQSAQILEVNRLYGDAPKQIPIPKIVTLENYDLNSETVTPTPLNRKESLNQLRNFHLYPNESVLSTATSTNNLPTSCSLSIYSADVSTNSACETLTANALKLSIERLHKRLQRLNNARPILPVDVESPDNSLPTLTLNGRKHGKKKRKSIKKQKGVKRIQLVQPTSMQLLVIVSFVILYFSVWLIMLCGVIFPSYSSITLSVCRLLMNIISSVNPLIQGFRHPRFALRILKTWRKIHPSSRNALQPMLPGA